MGCILRHDSKYSIKSVFLRMIFRTGLNLVGGGLAMVPLVLIVVPIAGTSPRDAAFRLWVEYEPSAHGGALPECAGARHRNACGLALRHQPRGLRLDRAAAGWASAWHHLAADRARPCCHQRL